MAKLRSFPDRLTIFPGAMTAGAARARSVVRGLVVPFYQFLFPPACLACAALLTEREQKVCRSCLASIKPVHRNDPLFLETYTRLTAEGMLSDFVSAYYFEAGGALQSLIHQLKYGGMTCLGTILGRKLGERILQETAGGRFVGVLPVPLHRSKERERGYNQSEWISEGIASVLGVPVLPRVLIRRTYTQTQTKLGAEERKRNVAGAFTVRQSVRASLGEGAFLLVDDVVTTGATMCSCAQALVDHGARAVVGCSVAVAM